MSAIECCFEHLLETAIICRFALHFNLDLNRFLIKILNIKLCFFFYLFVLPAIFYSSKNINCIVALHDFFTHSSMTLIF